MDKIKEFCNDEGMIKLKNSLILSQLLMSIRDFQRLFILLYHKHQTGLLLLWDKPHRFLHLCMCRVHDHSIQRGGCLSDESLSFVSAGSTSNTFEEAKQQRVSGKQFGPVSYYYKVLWHPRWYRYDTRTSASMSEKTKY